MAREVTRKMRKRQHTYHLLTILCPGYIISWYCYNCVTRLFLALVLCSSYIKRFDNKPRGICIKSHAEIMKNTLFMSAVIILTNYFLSFCLPTVAVRSQNSC